MKGDHKLEGEEVKQKEAGDGGVGSASSQNEPVVNELPVSSSTVSIEATLHNLVLLSELPNPSVAQLVDEERLRAALLPRVPVLDLPLRNSHRHFMVLQSMVDRWTDACVEAELREDQRQEMKTSSLSVVFASLLSVQRKTNIRVCLSPTSSRSTRMKNF